MNTVKPKTKIIPKEHIPAPKDRLTDELIIGMVGPVGSGASKSAELILELMTERFGYTGRIVKIRNFIDDATSPQAENTEANPLSEIESLQQAGTKMREELGSDILVKKSVKDIFDSRDSKTKPEKRRFVTILDSIKHPDEIRLLKEVYGDIFQLFCVFAPYEVRKNRLLEIHKDNSLVEKIFQIDAEGSGEFAQKVSKASHLADFFIRNDGDNTESLSKTILRYLDIVFDTAVVTPNAEESAMNNAAMAARGSACLSRQVGAVIITDDGEIIGKGRNDVPKFGGGLYSEEDGISDHRCHKWKHQECHNDNEKKLRFQRLSQELSAKLNLKEKDVLEILNQSEFRNLIEFSRSIHAEMDAILSVARKGSSKLVGSTIYCTTYPCHNCARHIIAAGIKRVVFVEPYPKSLAVRLHGDAIDPEGKNEGSVQFNQYEGVAPKNFDRYFSPKGERKVNGKLSLTSPREAMPAGAFPLDSLIARESMVIAGLDND